MPGCPFLGPTWLAVPLSLYTVQGSAVGMCCSQAHTCIPEELTPVSLFPLVTFCGPGDTLIGFLFPGEED